MSDSHPNNFKMVLFGLFGFLIGTPLFIYGLIYDYQIIGIVGFLIFLLIPSYFLGEVMSNEKSRFKIYQKGIIFVAVRYSKDPSKTPAGGWSVGKRIVKYESIETIHPFAYKFGKSKYLNSIGLQIVLPKEKNKFIAGQISYSGSKINNMPEVIQLLKTQMGSLWDSKYKKEEPLWIGDLEQRKIPMFVELGENP